MATTTKRPAREIRYVCPNGIHQQTAIVPTLESAARTMALHSCVQCGWEGRTLPPPDADFLHAPVTDATRTAWARGEWTTAYDDPQDVDESWLPDPRLQQFIDSDGYYEGAD